MKASDISNLDILRAIENHGANARNVLCWSYPAKVVEAKYSKLYKRGWIEYGVSLSTGWLTLDGREELNRLRAELATVT